MRDIRLDLHTHLKIAKRTPFRALEVERAAQTLINRNIRGLAVTEHAHGHGFWDLYDHLLRHHPYRHDRFEIGEARLYPGLELTLNENVDILFIAPISELRRLDDAFDHPLTEGYHPSAYELADTFATLDLDAIRIAAHPVRDDKPAHRVPEPLLGAVTHAVEINGRFTSRDEISAVETLARRLDLPIVGGSDAHIWPQIGAAFTTLQARSDHYADIRDAILAGRCAPQVDDGADRLVVVAERLKKRAKRRLPKLPRVPHIGPASPASSN